LQGKLVTAEGNTVAISSLQQPLVAKAEQKKVTEKPVLVSKLTTPNRAFGVTEQAKQQNVHIKMPQSGLQPKQVS